MEYLKQFITPELRRFWRNRKVETTAADSVSFSDLLKRLENAEDSKTPDHPAFSLEATC